MERKHSRVADDGPVVDAKIQFDFMEGNEDAYGDQRTANMGMAFPPISEHKHHKKDKKSKKRRKHQHIRHTASMGAIAEDVELNPSQRIQAILDDLDESEVEFHPVFTEMIKLHDNGVDLEWKEYARWVKFEEDVEDGGDRWSKPHVATLSLHSLVELRGCLEKGMVILDMHAADFDTMIDITIEKLMASDMLELHHVNKVKDVLMKRHVHQFEHSERKRMKKIKLRKTATEPAVRKLSTHLMRKNSKTDVEAGGLGDSPNDSSANLHHVDSSSNLHFLKKLPPGTESNIVMVGWLDYLPKKICVFVRLKDAISINHFSEVDVPVRFMCIIFGSHKEVKNSYEMGRSISTLMTDEVFRDIAYVAQNTGHILDAVDEFLDQVTVLPPGEWDPAIRIEPPTHVASQEGRLKHSASQPNGKGMNHSQDKDEKPNEKDLEKDTEGADAGDDKDDHDHGEYRHKDPALARTGKLFGGLVRDIKRKAPWYISDFKDAFHPQCLAAVFFMYFATLAPVVTFGGLLADATGNQMAAMENLVAATLCGVTYHLFAGQPLTVIASTGPLLVFETILYSICDTLEIDFLSFRLWVNLWIMVILIIAVATDASSLVSLITRFTEESFATLIALIFIVEAFKKVFGILGSSDFVQSQVNNATTCTCQGTLAPSILNTSWLQSKDEFSGLRVDGNNPLPWIKSNGSDLVGVDYSYVPFEDCAALDGEVNGDTTVQVFLMSLVLMLGTFYIAKTLKQIRRYISDFSVVTAILIMTLVDFALGINTLKLHVPPEFHPTDNLNRGWLINPFKAPIWGMFLAVVPAILACILIFMNQQITAVIVNRKENKLLKGCGYHLDLFVLSLLIGICGLLGLPSYAAATVSAITHVNALRVESESCAPGEVPGFVGVREQRLTGVLTFLLIGASIFMSGALSMIPMPVLYGVFLYMGVMALNSQLWDSLLFSIWFNFTHYRFLLIFMGMKWQPDFMYLRKVPIKTVHLFTAFQVLCLAVLWIIKSISATSILFPIMLIVMIGVRKLIERIFSKEALEALDDEMPDLHLKKKDEKEKKKKNEKELAVKNEKENNHHKFSINGLLHWNNKSTSKLHPVATDNHLHIPMATGNFMSIPLNPVYEHEDEHERDHENDSN